MRAGYVRRMTALSTPDGRGGQAESVACLTGREDRGQWCDSREECDVQWKKGKSMTPLTLRESHISGMLTHMLVQHDTEGSLFQTQTPASSARNPEFWGPSVHLVPHLPETDNTRI